MATLYQSRPEDIFDDPSISPSQALFPPHLYANGPMHAHRNSISGQSNGGGMDDDDYAAFQSSFLSGSISNHSRLPSLSPSAHSASYLSANAYQAHSPHSSASPKSNFSGSAYNLTDDILFNTSFGQDDLDMLLGQDGGMMTMGMSSGDMEAGKQKAGQTQSSFHLPQDWAFQISQQNQQQYQATHVGQNDNMFNANAFDFATLTSPKSNPIPTFTQNGYARSAGGSMSSALADDQSKAVDKQEVEEIRRQQRLQAEQIQVLLNQQQQQQQAYQMPNQGQLQTIPPSWMNMPQMPQVQGGGQGSTMMPGMQQNWSAGVPSAATTTTTNSSTKRALSPPPRKGRPPKSAKAPASSGDSASPPEHSGGKHNKTERRYRQKVQVAQAELRDAVPALRVHYGTSTEEQKATTDIRAPDGTVDGLGEVSRPNASAKATILIGSRMYIELLQNRTAEMQRMIDELIQYRVAVGGQADCDRWKADFDARAAVRREEQAKVKREIVDVDDSDSEEEEEMPKKRKRGPIPGAKKKKAEAEGGNGVRVFAAFAMSFSLVPSASTLLRYQPVGDISPGHVLSGEATPTQVISRLPLITAEHLYRVFTRVLPAVMVPTPGVMVDWTWRLLVAAVLVLVLGPMIRAWTKVDDEDVPAGAGDVMEMSKDAVKLGLRIKGMEDGEWTEYAARALGRVSQPSRLTRYHLALKLKRTASSSYALALLALIQPNIPFIASSASVWQQARQALTTDSPALLQAVLALPFDEARHALSLLPITSSPISSIADQITLVHLNDLYSRLFVHLVESTISRTSLPISVKALLDNLSSKNLKADLSSFDQDISDTLRGVSRGTAAHALGLVLIGLWGVFTGPAPSVQATLASALAGEEMSGVGLQSVPAMLDLLFPGASSDSPSDRLQLHALPQNAIALDKLAFVCIGYIRLLYTCGKAYPEVSKREKAIAISRATAELRMIITETNFVGLDSMSLVPAEEGGEEGDEADDAIDESAAVEGGEKVNMEGQKFEEAKERLVGVLSVIGRRAAGRGKADEDSGLDGEIDEL